MCMEMGMTEIPRVTSHSLGTGVTVNVSCEMGMGIKAWD